MGYVSCENRDMDKMDEVDRLNFALGGIARISTAALKDGLSSPRGYVSGYPRKLVEDFEFWLSKIKQLADEAESTNATERTTC